jgi:hypothetical protein
MRCDPKDHSYSLRCVPEAEASIRISPAKDPSESVRKEPRQSRSKATVETIHRAALQVLRDVGYDRLTTTRVAQRAGVSVGTL